ncbi:pyruvate dehydrogenase complex dehydrogenase (E1) component [Bradyrhizobium sp. USDA 4472]
MDAMRDSDTVETREWLDALAAVMPQAAAVFQFEQALTTPYCNAIPVSQKPPLPGDRAIMAAEVFEGRCTDPPPALRK